MSHPNWPQPGGAPPPPDASRWPSPITGGPPPPPERYDRLAGRFSGPRPRLLDGLVIGTAAAAIAGGLWWAVVANTRTQFVYGAIVVGVLVGQGVLLGARRGGVAPGAVAAACTLASLGVSEYFIQRSLAIAEGLEVDLWLGWSTAAEVVDAALRDDPLSGVFWAIAVVAAAVTAGNHNRSPLV